jgi:hypothetical protein
MGEGDIQLTTLRAPAGGLKGGLSCFAGTIGDCTHPWGLKFPLETEI